MLIHVNHLMKVERVLRVTVAGECIGRAVFVLQRNTDWVSEPHFATQILSVFGLMDIAPAIFLLRKPVRITLLWMAFWGFWTALV